MRRVSPGISNSFFHTRESDQLWNGILKNVMDNGDIEEFDGISLIEWSAERSKFNP